MFRVFLNDYFDYSFSICLGAIVCVALLDRFEGDQIKLDKDTYRRSSNFKAF